MFSIIISEKGGAERKETFDKNEINVGRVQGNDLMLPKGNVSKHHARLLFRDGRFIVTDLKSTNGTYVNGRKIAQATIVREGDKIYIGDFVLRVDTGNSQMAALDQIAPSIASDDESIRTLARNNTGNSVIPGPAIGAKAGSPSGGISGMPGPGGASIGPATHPPGARSSGLMPSAAPSSPFPLDRDPDDSEQMQAANRVSAPPMMNNGPALQPPMARELVQPPPPMQPPPPVQQPAYQAQSRSSAPGPVADQRPSNPPPLRGQSVAPGPYGSGSPNAGRQTGAPVARVAPRETAAQAGRRLASITLVDRIADAVDLRPLKASPVVDDAVAQQIERAAREQAAAMRDEGEAPEGIDIETLVRDAVRELVGLGPIGALLDDEEILEIDCVRHDQVLAVRESSVSLADTSFTSEEALYRVIARLAHQSGDPWREGEWQIERRLPRGGTMLALTPPAVAAHALVVRKRRRVDMTLEDLVRSGALARPVAVLLEAVLAARANVLVTGSSRAVTSGLLAALAAAGSPGERIAVVHDADEVNVAQAHLVSLPLPDTRARGAESVRAAARLGCDRLVIGTLVGHLASATVEAVADGAEGVIAGTIAPGLRQGLARAAAQLVLVHPSMSMGSAQDLLAETFDLALEGVAGPDGRWRVTRVSELSGSEGRGAPRDLFTTTESGLEATGITPRIASEIAARGGKLDTSIFRRR